MKKYITAFIPILLIFISSCEEDMDVNLNTGTNKRLVVDGYVTNHAVKDDTVKLSYTTDYFSNEAAPYISNADVSISDNENNIYQLENIGDGKYIVNKDDYKPKIGNTYNIDINVGDENYSSSGYLSSVASIDSITWYHNYISFEDEYFYSLVYYGQEPAEEGNNYMWLVYLNNKLVTDTLREALLTNDKQVNGSYIKDWDMIFFSEEEFDNDTKYNDNTGKEVIPDTIDVKVEIYSIPFEYYEFFVAAMLETVWKGGPFDGPPANVPSNISNNAVGFFYASAVSDYEFKLIRSEKEDRKRDLY